MNLRVIIVEDRPRAQNVLKKLLWLHPDVEIVGVFEDTATASKLIEAGNIDVVFLDIEIETEGKLAGLDLALRIDRLDLPRLPKLVFTTAHKEPALSAHQVRPYGYLLKPLDDAKVAQVLEKIRKIPMPLAPPLIKIDYIAIINGERVRGTKYVSEDEILYIQTNYDGKTVKVQLVNGDILDGNSITLKEWQNNYDLPNFMRIHKSQLVNLKHVNGYKRNPNTVEGHNITFRGCTTELPVSKSQLDGLRKALGGSVIELPTGKSHLDGLHKTLGSLGTSKKDGQESD